MRFIKSLKKEMKKGFAKTALLFLFSVTKVYAGVYPFGLSALCVWGKSPVDILIYIVSVSLADMGFSAYLRHIFALVILKISEKFLKNRVPDFIILGSSVMLGGALSLLVLKEKNALLYLFAASEAVFSSVFIVVFDKTRKAILSKNRGEVLKEGELMFPLLSMMTLCLAFSDIDIGKISVCSVLLLLFGMAASYKCKAAVSAVINMATGFFFMSFTPANAAASLYLILSGFIASTVKKYGKFLIPVTYVAFLPFFAPLKVDITSIYIEDTVIASLLFMLLPGRIYSFFDAADVNTDDFAVRVSEKINMAAETFRSISEIFSGLELRVSDCEEKDAPRLTVESVCSDCARKGRCSEEAERVLREFVSEKGAFRDRELSCVRKRELLSVFSGNYRVIRMENVLSSHIREENEAFAEEMACVAELLKGVASKEDVVIKRDSVAEGELYPALRRKGIGVKEVIAGKNSEGLMQIIIAMSPCKGAEFCDNYCESVIKETLGIDVIRYGIRRCKGCRVTYSEAPPLKIEKAVATHPAGEISGDSVAFSYIDGEHFAVALSDGMGTGAKAGYKSKAASFLATELLSVGMKVNSAPAMVNTLLLRQGGRDFVTLDIALIDLETGEVEISKNASASGYILKCGGKVVSLSMPGTPLGIVGKVDCRTKKYRMGEGDFLIMVSDGVADCFTGKESLEEKIGMFISGSADNLADYIMSEAVRIGGKNIKDDMTVVAVGCIRRQKSGKTKEKGGSIYEKRQKSYYSG
ncbi:MAG: SpoIIE family protein phosphatase [Clostridia bacterium]|nr:SpoIIE family protein phosphatase [Clostridia bacterium]